MISNTKEEYKEIKSEKDLLLMINNLGEYIIRNKKIHPNSSRINNDFYEYYPYIKNDSNQFGEVLKIKYNNNKKFALSLFNFIITLDDLYIKDNMDKIELFFSNNNSLTLKDVRGFWAEIHLLSSDHTININHNNAIYDFLKNGNDYEVKSYSPIKKTINVSLQQIQNNRNAIFLCCEIRESSEGISLRNMLTQNFNGKKRYLSLIKKQSPLLDIKFILHNSKEIILKDIIGNIEFSPKIINANLEILII